MQLQQLRYFLEVAQTKNITAAAKNLILSQPSLSQQIINLERELEVPLLIRHPRSVELTDAGEQLVLHARRILGDVDQLTELMHRHSLLQVGTLRVGLLWVAGYLDLFRFLSDYRQGYPGLSFDLKIDGSGTLLDLVCDHALHAAFLISTAARLEQRKGLFYQKLLEDPYVMVLPAGDPLAGRESISMADLKDRAVIMPAGASSLRRDLDHLFDRAGVSPKVLCETSQTDIVFQLVSHGLGLGFSSSSIARSLKTPEIVIRPLEAALTRSLYYVTLEELLAYPSIRAFSDFVAGYDFSSGAGELPAVF